jgi:hypothetical protein
MIKIMPYPERKPIYDAYKEIIEKIVDSKLHKEYAEAEIEALDKELLDSFKSIRTQVLIGKNWKA